MKRFLEVAIALLALVVLNYFLLFRSSVISPFTSHDEAHAIYRSHGTSLERLVGEEWKELRLRGAEVSSAIPGHPFSDYAATYDDYARWLVQIGKMGANAVVVNQLMEDEFYDALIDHNAKETEPLYLVQGITAEDEYDNSPKDALASGLMDRLVEQGKIIVDAIHGRRDVQNSGTGGTGSYRSDVSPWVCGYLIMDELNVDTVALTDHTIGYSSTYEGTYYTASEDATVFEAALAQTMDKILNYEADSYGEQRPLGFTCDALCDFLVYDKVYAEQLRKYVCVDANHVVPTTQNEAGSWVAYRLGDAVNDYGEYLSAEFKEQHADLLAKVNTTTFEGYLQLVRAYHTMPVLGFFSASSARGIADKDVKPLTEQEQGEALLEVSNALGEAGWNGELISTWQDVWSRRSWNTAFATMIDTTYLWHDVQTVTQCEGLLAFDPGAERVCVVDGDDAEWTKKDVVARNGGMTLSARYDAEGLYLLVRGVDEKQSVYVPLDISPEVGTNACAKPALEFGGDADFLLCLKGTRKSRLLVQERYDATRKMFLYNITGGDPFVAVVDARTTKFVMPTLALANNTLVAEFDEQARELVRMGTWKTGKLTHGNADPEAKDYNSLADFCYGEGCVEVRLPWLLINVGDAGHMKAHRDYYDCYGVEFARIRHIGMGVAVGEPKDPIPLKDFAVRGWKDVDYVERLKQSYEVMRGSWQGGDNT